MDLRPLRSTRIYQIWKAAKPHIGNIQKTLDFYTRPITAEVCERKFVNDNIRKKNTFENFIGVRRISKLGVQSSRCRRRRGGRMQERALPCARNALLRQGWRSCVIVCVCGQDNSLSVRLSVCPSVRDVPVLDENGLTYCHRFFHDMVAQSFKFYQHQTSSRNSDWITTYGGAKYRWGIKISRFSTNRSLYLADDTR